MPRPIGRLFMIPCCLALWSCDRAPSAFRIEQASPLAIATFAGNINILQSFGDGSVSHAPEQAQSITRLLLLETVRRLKAKGIAVQGVSVASLQSGLDASQLGRLVQEDRGWVRRLRGRGTYVAVGAGVPVLQPSSSVEIARIAARHEVPIVLWSISSYEWETGGWGSVLPFGRTDWRFKIRTALKVLDGQGRVRWEDVLSAESGDAETGAGRNYVMYSSSSLTGSQAGRLVESAIAKAADAIARRVTILYGGE